MKLSQSEVRATREGGEDKTRPNAPEAASLGEEFWRTVHVVMPFAKSSVRLRLDSDIVEWFKGHGRGHLTRMNAGLRAYVDAHKRSA